MRVKNYILCLMLVTAYSSFAQEDDKPAPFKRPAESYSKDTVRTGSSELRAFESPKKKFDIKKMIIEPNVQLYFDAAEYNFGLMPYIGYEIKKNLYLGATVDYNLTYVPHVDPTTNTSPSESLQVYGGGPFLQYHIWKGFFARMTTEVLAVRYANTDNVGNITGYATRGVPYIWIGGGYNVTASKNFFMPLAVYFNPLYATYDGTVQSVAPYSYVYFQLTFYIFSPAGSFK